VTSALVAACVAAAAQQQRPFVERVDVARVLIVARAVDDRWRAIRGLEAADFLVEIDGEPARVESAEWVDGFASPASSPSPGAEPSDGRRRTSGRLVVALVQKDLERSRIAGLMQMMQMVDPVLEAFTPDDRIAVLSFDSRLRIWTDFTNDVSRVRSILRHDVLLRHPPPVTASRDVSLVASLEQGRGREIFGIERALQRIGEALEPMPGAKSIILIGFGFGRFNARTGGVTLMDGYEEAEAALQRSRTAVFALNITRANYNSLQAGLQSVARATGGLYASTYEFPGLALERVRHALEGHYVLFVERPPRRGGERLISVRLARRAGRVYARRSYVE
jgi:VWFA-related protein